jgi:hypothetical protein
MPMPGISQKIDSIELAYQLYSWRWGYRFLLSLLILSGIKSAFLKNRILSSLSLLILTFVFYIFNYYLSADSMFLQPKKLIMNNISENKIAKDQLVIGIVYNGQAKAYPIQFLAYHHQIRDNIDNKALIITYCSVCRSGRVFEPVIDGRNEEFRLVGMDNFNAMFEDKKTKSWWRQVNGEAIAGSLKGKFLPEFPFMQTTLEKWSKLYPKTMIMQPDEHFLKEYDQLKNYEQGKSKGNLTRRDRESWKAKSWIIGVLSENSAKAYDWNLLQEKEIIYDSFDKKPIVLILSNDKNSFVVLERNDYQKNFSLQSDSIKSGLHAYSFNGKSLLPGEKDLKMIKAYQEYWQSWKTFHPNTIIYKQ